MSEMALCGATTPNAYRRRQPHVGGARSWIRVDVSAIRLGIDWQARAALQRRLEELARSGNTRTQRGLSSLFQETVTALKDVEPSWLYCTAANYRPMSPASAERIFQNLAIDSRAKFRDTFFQLCDRLLKLEIGNHGKCASPKCALGQGDAAHSPAPASFAGGAGRQGFFG